jgi:hypothetical protein
MSKKLILLAVAAIFMTQAAVAGEILAERSNGSNAPVKSIPWLIKPLLIDVLRAQNAAHAGLTQAEINILDAQWRAERTSADRPLINKVMTNPLSQFLKALQENSNGLFTEIFVMDSKGLNVGQSVLSDDYWQGDEAKWRKSFLAGSNARHIGEPEFVEATGRYQAQLSMPIIDPKSGAVIGAVTLGVDISVIEMLTGCSALSGKCGGKGNMIGSLPATDAAPLS